MRYPILTLLTLLAALLPAASGQQFTNATASANLTWNNSTTLWRFEVMLTSWVDYDNDGDFDLHVHPHAYRAAPNLRRSTIFPNLGNGTFGAPVMPMAFGNDVHEGMWADYDNDGDADFMMQNGGGAGSGLPTPRRFYRNDGGGIMTTISSNNSTSIFPYVPASGTSPETPAGQRLGSGRGCLFFDWNKDGKLELILFNADIESQGNYSELLELVNGAFVNRNTESGFSTPGYAFFGAVTDLFGDGKPDLIAFDGQQNDLGFIARAYENATSTLVDRSNELPIEAKAADGRDATIGDFNGDLIPDIIFVRTWFAGPVGTTTTPNPVNLPSNVTSEARAIVYLESSPTGYRYRSIEAGLGTPYFGASIGAADFDNDGDLDLYTCGQVSRTSIPPKYFQNNGSGVFTEVANANGALYPQPTLLMKVYDQDCGMSFTIGDYDNDGDQDIYLAMQPSTTPVDPDASDVFLNHVLAIDAHLFRNNGNSNKWVQFKLVGTDSNRDAIGAKVILTAGGKSQLREQTGMMRRNAQDMSRIHFGLGNTTSITSAVVYWPNGQTTTYTGLAVNQIHTLTEPNTPANYNEWATTNGLPGNRTGNANPTATPLNDGTTQLMKYAFGLAPSNFGLGNKISQGRLATNSEILTLSARLPKPLRSDVTITAQVSTNLTSWNNTAIEVSRVDHADGTQTITWRHPNLAPGQSRQFLRLNVTLNP